MIREMRREDRQLFLDMTEEFYASEAVLHPIPESFRVAAWEEMMRSDCYVKGYILESENQPAGYAQLSFTFSQEAGGKVAWLEELYVREAFRGHGLGKEFFAFVKSQIEPAVARVRLEVEPENERARKLYQAMGYRELPYLQMIKELEMERTAADKEE